MAVHISMKVNRNVPRRFRLSPLYPKRENAPMPKDEERQQGDNQILADLIVMHGLHDCTREGDTGCSKRQSLEQVGVLSLSGLMAKPRIKLAKGVGFEPTEVAPQSGSGRPPSTTQPTLQNQPIKNTIATVTMTCAMWIS